MVEKNRYGYKRKDKGLRVVTADKMSEIVKELGPEGAAREVDVVTTGTFCAMYSSGGFMNFGHADPSIKMQTKNGKIVPEDETVADEDEIKVIRVIHGG